MEEKEPEIILEANKPSKIRGRSVTQIISDGDVVFPSALWESEWNAVRKANFDHFFADFGSDYRKCPGPRPSKTYPIKDVRLICAVGEHKGHECDIVSKKSHGNWIISCLSCNKKFSVSRKNIYSIKRKIGNSWKVTKNI